MPTPPLPEEVQAEFRRLRAEGLTISEIARRTRRDRGVVRRYLDLAGQPAPAVDPVAAQRQRAEAEARRKEHVTAVRELAFRDVLKTMIEANAPAIEPPPRYKPHKPPKGAVTESLLLNLSDWHSFEWVRPEATFGLNEYDAPTTGRRARTVVAKTLEIKDRLESGGYRFPVLVCAVNGDMVSGTIHEIERHTDAPNIVQAVLRCATLLAESLRDLSAQFERVYAFGTAGNHGRLPDARKVQSKEPTRSWDYLIYEYARALLRDCPNVQFECPDSWAVMYDLEGYLFYQGHGHFIKSWNSIPFYGITRMTSRLGAVLAKHFRPVDYWLFGHFHTMGSIENAGGEYIINPPLIGPQEFGIHSYGDAVAPGQLLFGVHEKHGITHRWRLKAEDVWPPPGRQLPAMRIRSQGA